ncbi:hypothetical protein BaRGS_00005733 [Batillaria attramentaria]|uniref:RING-type domain-containing protein n=1 Tax=Batillaria attramentaria TaxID=370345 RepID=A0ABD0LUW1_9CAEN
MHDLDLVVEKLEDEMQKLEDGEEETSNIRTCIKCLPSSEAEERQNYKVKSHPPKVDQDARNTHSHVMKNERIVPVDVQDLQKKSLIISTNGERAFGQTLEDIRRFPGKTEINAKTSHGGGNGGSGAKDDSMRDSKNTQNVTGGGGMLGSGATSSSGSSSGGDGNRDNDDGDRKRRDTTPETDQNVKDDEEQEDDEDEKRAEGETDSESADWPDSTLQTSGASRTSIPADVHSWIGSVHSQTRGEQNNPQMNNLRKVISDSAGTGADRPVGQVMPAFWADQQSTEEILRMRLLIDTTLAPALLRYIQTVVATCGQTLRVAIRSNGTVLVTQLYVSGDEIRIYGLSNEQQDCFNFFQQIIYAYLADTVLHADYAYGNQRRVAQALQRENYIYVNGPSDFRAVQSTPSIHIVLQNTSSSSSSVQPFTGGFDKNGVPGTSQQRRKSPLPLSSVDNTRPLVESISGFARFVPLQDNIGHTPANMQLQVSGQQLPPECTALPHACHNPLASEMLNLAQVSANISLEAPTSASSEHPLSLSVTRFNIPPHGSGRLVQFLQQVVLSAPAAVGLILQRENALPVAHYEIASAFMRFEGNGHLLPRALPMHSLAATPPHTETAHQNMPSQQSVPAPDPSIPTAGSDTGQHFERNTQEHHDAVQRPQIPQEPGREFHKKANPNRRGHSHHSIPPVGRPNQGRTSNLHSDQGQHSNKHIVRAAGGGLPRVKKAQEKQARRSAANLTAAEAASPSSGDKNSSRQNQRGTTAKEEDKMGTGSVYGQSRDPDRMGDVATSGQTGRIVTSTGPPHTAGGSGDDRNREPSRSTQNRLPGQDDAQRSDQQSPAGTDALSAGNPQASFGQLNPGTSFGQSGFVYEPGDRHTRRNQGQTQPNGLLCRNGSQTEGNRTGNERWRLGEHCQCTEDPLGDSSMDLEVNPNRPIHRPNGVDNFAASQPPNIPSGELPFLVQQHEGDFERVRGRGDDDGGHAGNIGAAGGIPAGETTPRFPPTSLLLRDHVTSFNICEDDEILERLNRALEERRRLRRRRLCRICGERWFNVALLPCGHTMCADCAVGLGRCPICRKLILFCQPISYTL